MRHTRFSSGTLFLEAQREKAGLRAGDRIIGVNSMSLTTPQPWTDVYMRSRPGDPLELTVSRQRVQEAVSLRGLFRSRVPSEATEGLARSSAQAILNLFPVLFVLVGFAVLFLRLDDSNAWLLALMFTAFAAAPDFPDTLLVPDLQRHFGLIFRAVFNGLLPGAVLLLFLLFSRCAPLWIGGCRGSSGLALR